MWCYRCVHASFRPSMITDASRRCCHFSLTWARPSLPNVPSRAHVAPPFPSRRPPAGGGVCAHGVALRAQEAHILCATQGRLQRAPPALQRAQLLLRAAGVCGRAAAAQSEWVIGWVGGVCTVHLLPHSEHSSFSKLLESVGALPPHKVGGWVGGYLDKWGGWVGGWVVTLTGWVGTWAGWGEQKLVAPCGCRQPGSQKAASGRSPAAADEG